MIITTHVLVGSAIASHTDNVWVIIILAFLSHFVLDALPHLDVGTPMEQGDVKYGKLQWIGGYLDVLMAGVSVISFAILFRDRFWLIILGAFFAGLVDFIDNVPFWREYLWRFKIGRIKPFLAFHHFHEKIHFRLPMKYWYIGLLSDIVVTGVAIYYIIR